MSTETRNNAWSVDQHDFPYGGDPECRYEYLVRYASLAPSSHNSQPWLFEVSHDGLDLYADPTRALPVVDPENRALVISCGAALEYLCVSARFFGYNPLVTYDNPGNNPDFLARFSLGPKCKPDSLDTAMFEAIPRRHTNRMKFEDTPLPAGLAHQLQFVAGSDHVFVDVFEQESDRHELARLVSEGDRIQAADPQFRRELAGWIHANRTRSRDGMPGYAHGTGDVTSFFTPLIVRTFDWGKGQGAKDEQLVMGSPMLAILSTQNDTKTDWLNTGRALAKILLLLTDRGLSASFLNQPIEVPDLRPALKNKLSEPFEPQILIRIGYGPESRPTPRRRVDEIIVKRP